MKSLIFGYLERIASDVFDNYHKEITALIGKQHGVYALYKKNHLYYVGLAGNLKTRVTQHLKDRHAKKWDYFSLYLIRNVNYLRELESLLVHISEPKGNIARGRFARSGNLLKVLDSMMEQRDRKRREEMLAGSNRRKLAKRRQPRRQGGGGRSKKPVLQGLFHGRKALHGTFKKNNYTARVDRKGRVHLAGKTFNSPSLAAMHITGGAKDGWYFWKFKDKDGSWKKLDVLRSH